MTQKGVFAAYGVAGALARPLAAPYLRLRARKGKEDPARLGEKQGIIAPDVALPDRPIWLHAVSLGEAGVALQVAERLSAEGHNVLITTVTPAGADRVAAAGVPHLYAPLDVTRFVTRFLDRVSPRAALFVEAEVWPATLGALAARDVPRAHVNARISQRSFKRWQRTGGLARTLFSMVPLALCQSAHDATRLSALGVPDVSVTGNIKFDAPAPIADVGKLAALRAAIGTRPVWVAASIHAPEAEAVAAAHRVLAETHPGLVSVCVPRHPAAADALMAAEPTARRRSDGALPEAGLYVADTFGEMGTMLSLSSIVFLGGSLAKIGGHNPAEPAAFGAAILTGPSFGPMFGPFFEADAALCVADAGALAAAVGDLLSDPERARAMGERARVVRAKQEGALGRTMDGLSAVLARAAQAR